MNRCPKCRIMFETAWCPVCGCTKAQTKEEQETEQDCIDAQIMDSAHKALEDKLK